MGAALMAVLAASNQGCGKPVLRVADASLGDYYTNREFKKLSREARAEYCAELAKQDSLYKSEMAELRDRLDQSHARSLQLRAEGDSLFALGTRLEKEGPRAHRHRASRSRMRKHHRIHPGQERSIPR